MVVSRWRRVGASGLLALLLSSATTAVAAAQTVPTTEAAPSSQPSLEPSQVTPDVTTSTEPPTPSSTGSTTTASTEAPAPTTTVAPTPTSVVPETTTTVTEPEVVEEEVEEVVEEVVEEETATTRATTRPTRPAPTMLASSTTVGGPQSSLVAPATATTASTTGTDTSREQRVVWLIVGLLCVVGLLIAALTWRYWWFTDPKRGYVRSRAVLSQKALRDDPDSEVLRVWQDGQAVPPPDVPVPGSPRPPAAAALDGEAQPGAHTVLPPRAAHDEDGWGTEATVEHPVTAAPGYDSEQDRRR